MPERIVEARVLEPVVRRDIMTDSNPRRLLRRVRRASLRGELAGTGRLEQVAPGKWAVPVSRLREAPLPPPVWVRPALVSAGVMIVISGIGYAGYLLLSSLVAVAAGVGMGGLLGLAVVFLGLRALSSGGGCETTVTVRHRH